MNIASSSEFSGRDKKFSTTSFGSGVAGEDYLSTTLERRLSKDKSEALGTYTIAQSNFTLDM